MIKNFEWLIALRYLRSKRKDSFISIVSGFSLIGIILGVATLIIVMSVMNGYHKEFLKNILGIQGHLTFVSKVGKGINNYTALENEITKNQQVKFAAPIIIDQAMAISKVRSTGVVIRGIEGDKLEQKPLMKNNINNGYLEQFKKGAGVLLGISLARELKVGVGDEIKLVAPESSNTILGSIPRMKTFKVVGIYDVGLHQYNSTTIFMPLADAQLFYKYYNSVSEIEVMVENPESLAKIKKIFNEQFGDSFAIVDWAQAQEKWLNALAVERTVMFLILTLIIVVAAFNIISSLIMLVKDKSSNIAILRTIGIEKKSVVKIFVICGTMIGVIGTIIGAIIGVIFSLNIENIRRFLESLTGFTLFDPVIYFLTQLPSHLEIGNVIFIVIMSLVFSLLATIYPAWRAAKLSPTEVLRYE
jgi:lipoprotein-releasing system permease protein